MQFSSKLEAQMAAQSLIDHGIKAEVAGYLDYAAHATGSDAGAFSLMVEDEKLIDAENILRLSKISLVDQEPVEIKPFSYFRKAVVFAILGVVMAPLLANYVSLQNLKSYWSAEKNKLRKSFFTGIVMLLQIPGLFSFYFLIKSILK